jgi:hypothetical protein
MRLRHIADQSSLLDLDSQIIEWIDANQAMPICTLLAQPVIDALF